MTAQAQPEVRIAVHGSYGNGNFGDWLLLRLLVDEIKMLKPDATVVLPLGSVKDLSEIQADARGIGKAVRATHLIFGGGGYFGAPARGELMWAVRNSVRHVPPWLVFGKMSRVPFLITGVGVGPLRTRFGRTALGGVLRAGDHVTVRDEESAQWARQLGVRRDRLSVGCDWAMSLAEQGVSASDAERTGAREGDRWTLHVSRAVCASPRFSRIVRAVVERLRAEGVSNWVVLTDNLADNTLLHPAQLAVLGLGEDAIQEVVPFVGVAQLMSILAQKGRVITSKLHVGITSLCLGGRVFSLAAHPKIGRFFRQMALGDDCVEIWRQDEEADPQSIAVRAAALLIADDEEVGRFPRGDLSLRLQTNREALRRFLARSSAR